MSLTLTRYKTISRSRANDYRKNSYNGFENQHNQLRKINNCKPLPGVKGPVGSTVFANRKMGAGLIGLAISMNRSLRKDRQSETLPHYFGQPWKQHQMSPV